MTESVENAVSDAWESAGGWFEDAGIEVEKVADDPYGFGNSFHIVMVKECRQPKVTEKGDKLGVFMFFEIIGDKYENVRPFGKWMQLPTPKVIQDATGIPFNIHANPEDMAVAFNLKRFVWSLGFAADEVNKANHVTMTGRHFLTRLQAREEDGFWRIGFALGGTRPMPEDGTEEYAAVMARASGMSDGMNESVGGNSGGSKTLSAAEQLRKELEEAAGA